MISISNQSQTLSLLNALKKATDMTNKSAERLSSGYRINSASDDPAGYMIASGLTKQMKGYEAANQNAVAAQSITKIAESGFQSLSDAALEIKSLALQASSASDDEKVALEAKAKSIMDQMRSIKNSTKYSDNPVYKEEGYTFQVGYTTDEYSKLSLDTSLEAGDLHDFDIDSYEVDFTSEDANLDETIETFDQLTDDLNMKTMHAANVSTSLDSIIESQEVTYANIVEARSNIIDTDVAYEMSELVKSEIMSSMVAALMQQTQSMNANLLLGLISGVTK